eukprot:8979075-Alexandrium_andersonii.AAC.1
MAARRPAPSRMATWRWAFQPPQVPLLTSPWRWLKQRGTSCHRAVAIPAATSASSIKIKNVGKRGSTLPRSRPLRS